MSIETTIHRALNFSAGPAILPLSVLEQIRDELLCLPDVGSSILEISHRSGPFGEILEDATSRLRRVYSIPDDYEILLLQGGAVLQNTMVPANLLIEKNQTADYILTGAWGQKSSRDVQYFGKLNVAWDGANEGFVRLPQSDELKFSPHPAYVHYTSNETIHGVQFQTPLSVNQAPLVCDSSSDILSRPLDISRFGLIYACAQKNCGIAGITIVIIRKDLLQRSGDRLPLYLDYAKHAAANSMANTPSTFGVYVLGLVCRWLEETIGGLDQMQSINEQKARMLYQRIDDSAGFYVGHARPADRSRMNVVFTLANRELEPAFLQQAMSAGMISLKGHRSLGGIRASIYNAMPVEGVQTLAEFMQDFAEKNG